MIPYVMCTKSYCPKANCCYRFMALTDETQLYNDFIGLCNSEDGFQMFMKIKERDSIRDLNSKAIPEEIN